MSLILLGVTLGALLFLSVIGAARPVASDPALMARPAPPAVAAERAASLPGKFDHSAKTRREAVSKAVEATRPID